MPDKNGTMDKVNTWVTIIATILTLVVGTGWFQEYEKNQHAKAEANQRLMDD
jgi:hypothetical protein